MSDGEQSFAPLFVPEVQLKNPQLAANQQRLPGRMVHAAAATPAPITASRLEIGGTWVQKVEFPVFEAADGSESEQEPAPEKPVVVKAAGESAHLHPILSPSRPVREDAARAVRKTSDGPQRIPVRRPLIQREKRNAPALVPGKTADPPPCRATAASIREAKTDPRRITKIDSCFAKLLPSEPAAGPPLSEEPA